MDGTYSAAVYCYNCQEWEAVQIPRGVGRTEYVEPCDNCGWPRKKQLSTRATYTHTGKLSYRTPGISGANWRT